MLVKSKQRSINLLFYLVIWSYVQLQTITDSACVPVDVYVLECDESAGADSVERV